MDFEQEKQQHILAYKDELVAILNGDIEDLINNHELEAEDGEEPSIDNFVDTVMLGMEKPLSGLMMDEKFGVEAFQDDVSYVIFNRTTGGPSTDYIVGSNGDAFLRYAHSGQTLERVYGNYENSPLHEKAENMYGREFSNNEFEMDDDETSLRAKIELGVDSIEEWILQEADAYDTEVLSFKEFVSCLKECGFDAQEATKLALDDGWFNVTDTDGKNFTKEDFVKDIESHIETLEALKEHDQFYDLDSAFGGVNENKLTNFDADDLESELNEQFPEQKVKSKNKRKM